MQVERQHRGACSLGGEWRTGEECIGICLVVGDNLGKPGLIPHETAYREVGSERGGPQGLSRQDEPMPD